MNSNTPFTVDKGRTSQKSRRKTLLIPALIIGGMAAAIGAGFWLMSSAPAEAPKAVMPKPAMIVTLGTSQSQVWPEVIETSGNISAWQETVISGQIGGLQLREVRVNVGDRVKKGQILAVFDPVTPRAELARLSAAFEQAEAVAAQADANRKRAESLSDSGAISDQESLRYVTEADTARANVKAAQAALEGQQEQITYTVVRAPDDGVIVARTASLGSIGGVGQELFRMIPKGRLEWRGELTAAQLSRVLPGQSVELSLPDGRTALARIRQTAPSLDPATRLGLIYADLVEPGSARAGMYVGGRIMLPEQPAITVPAASVVLRDGRHYLFTVTPRADVLVVRAREVTTGRRQGARIEITMGDIGNARIVISGAGFLKDGDVVKEARPLAPKATQQKAIQHKAPNA